MDNILCCPVCKESLEKVNNSYVCKYNHGFDIAKQGYVNLLKANQKHTNKPGDNKEMMLARRDFLNSGAYEPLLNKIVEVIKEKLNPNHCVNQCGNLPKFTLLEAGCGEGYYISNIKNSVSNAYCYGFDISKDAVLLASKRSKDVNFYVASSYNSNVKDKSVDVLLVIFAPFAEEEYHRILKDNGICIVVKPNANHLIELKKCIYDNVKDIKVSAYKMFNICSTYSVSYSFTPDEQGLYNLIKMTPYFYAKNAKNTQNLQKNLKKVPIKADFLLEVLKK